MPPVKLVYTGTTGDNDLDARLAVPAAAIAALQAGAAEGVIGYATKAAMDADLTPGDGKIAIVTNDPTPAYNGTWRKQGASGAGSWVQASDDRVALVEQELAEKADATAVDAALADKADTAAVNAALAAKVSQANALPTADEPDFAAGALLYLFSSAVSKALRLDRLAGWIARLFGVYVVGDPKYGAAGDGVTNDTAAILATFADAIAAGGGTVRFVPGKTYIVQNAIISAAQHLTVDLRGAIVRVKAGAEHGRINDADALQGRAFRFQACSDLTILGGVIDGNRDNLNYAPSDGYVGDGRAHCLAIHGCTDVLIDGTLCLNGGTDGLYIGGSAAAGTESQRVTVRALRSENARRNGCSVTGGIDVDFFGCRFSNAHGTAPHSACDVEATPPWTTVRVSFTACQFVGSPAVAQSRGLVLTATATQCRVAGCYFADARYVLGNLTISGTDTVIEGCVFSNVNAEARDIHIDAGSVNAVVQGNVFRSPGDASGALVIRGTGATVAHNRFYGATIAISEDSAATGSVVSHNVSHNHTGSWAFQFSGANPTVIGNRQIGGAGNSMRLASVSVLDGVFIGNTSDNGLVASLGSVLSGHYPRTWIGNQSERGITYRSAAPTTGAWKQGDRVLNTATTKGTVREWLCASGGTPGTWRPAGVVPGLSNLGDANATLTAGTSAPTQRCNTPLTANRMITLDATGAWDGAKFRIIRATGATGAFALDVGGLKALTGPDQWCEVEHDGSAWKLTASGTLAVQTLPAAATDAATTQALANAVRSALITLGLAT